MKQSATTSTTMSVPASPTISAHSILSNKLGVNSIYNRSQSPKLTKSSKKKDETEIETILEKAKFYTSVCLGKYVFLFYIN